MNVFLRHAMVSAASLLALASCSTSVKEFNSSPGTSHDALAHDGLVILGCTSTVDTTDALVISNHMCPELAGALTHANKSVNMTGWAQVKTALGANTRPCLVRVCKSGALAPADLDSLAKALPKPRYVLVHRIEHDEISLDQDDFYEDVNGKSTKTGKKYQTKRKMTASFWIYDVKTHERVWAATIDSNKQAEETVRGDVNDDNTVGSILDALGTAVDLTSNYDWSDGPYPFPPTPDEVMARIYERFSDMLLSGK
jgi:hypothetical protein